MIELQRWGLDGHTELRDPGETLLRLVTQSAVRVELYARLLGEAYEAAERLHAGQDPAPPPGHGGELAEVVAQLDRDDEARADLRRVFRTGGVAALIGTKRGVDKQGNVFDTEEAIRGLAQLEADERDRCANFAGKAIAAGLAERQVRLAERQGALVAGAVRAILADLGLTTEQEALVGVVVPRHLRAIATIDGEVVGK